MSFVPGFAPDAASQWRELDPVLKEMVLDELAGLCATPPPPQDLVRRDFVHESAGVRHYVFLRFVVERSRGIVRVIGVAHFARPLGGRS